MSSKSALDLLSVYNNNSSDDDEVPGSRVSTKRIRNDDNDCETQRTKLLKLPLPNLLTSLGVVENEKHIDDPSLHKGRIRTFPHERGNWATYVYIPYEHNEIDILIHNLIKRTPVDMKPMEQLHVSLTKTIILRHHWIDSFIDTVRSKLGLTKRFALVFNTLRVYCNEERTRTFLGIHIQVGYDSLIHIVRNLDDSLREFNLPTFYENPSFHMSIAWCVGDHEESLNNILSDLNLEMQKFIDEYIQTVWYNYVTNIHCKCGNKLFTFELS